MNLTRYERAICKRLGLSPDGLKLLARAAADPKGRASGAGQGLGSGSIRVPLEKKGLVTSREGPDYQSYITEAGRDIVKRARAMGW